MLVRNAETLKLVQVFVCVDKVERLEWSPDSEFILTEVARPGVVQVFGTSSFGSISGGIVRLKGHYTVHGIGQLRYGRG